MSKELYPSNSTIVDLRSKISSIQATSKTKLFVSELNRHGTPAAATTRDQFLQPNRTCESERWFSPRPSDDMNNSLPPKRSVFTPSRLQNISAQRSRESKKPYWRCPVPTKKSENIQTPLTSIERILRENLGSSYTHEEQQSTTKTSSLAVTPIPMKSFVRRREPDNGKKTNVMNIADEELTLERDDSIIIENQLAKIKPPTLFDAPKAGFLNQGSTFPESRIEGNAQTLKIDDLVFTFADPVVREPKSPMPPPKEAGIQTEEFHGPSPTAAPKEIGTQTEEVTIHEIIGETKNGTPKDKSQSLFTDAALLQQQPITTKMQPSFALPVNGSLKFGSRNSEPSMLTVDGILKQPNLQQNIAPLVNGRAFQFGTTAPSTTAVTSTSQQPLFNTTASFGGFQFNTNPPPPADTGATFQFEAPVNGTFQFGTAAPTATADDGMTQRSGISARKLLHARRMKKR